MEWNWLKRYRAWRANRKEFLAPENGIEPELRDDKTSVFPTELTSPSGDKLVASEDPEQHDEVAGRNRPPGDATR